jgi:hypothetical protein
VLDEFVAEMHKIPDHRTGKQVGSQFTLQGADFFYGN